MNADASAAFLFDPRAEGLERLGHAQVVELLPGGGIDFQELRTDNRPGEIVGNELTDLAGLDHVLPDPGQPLRGRLKVGRNDVAARKAVLDHFGIAHIGGEERLHLGPIDPGQEKDLVGGLFEQLEELGGEDIAGLRHQGDDHAIGPAEFALVFRERADVGMVERQAFVETGVDPQVPGVPTHDHRQQAEPDHQPEAVAERPRW